MTLEEIVKIQREERFLRKNPHLKYPISLPDDVLKEFSLPNKSEVKITFIIPFRGIDRFPQLKKCVQNLVARYKECEVLLVEDGPEPIIKQPIPGARYIFVYNKRLFNKSKCFNIGFLAASNDIICGLDGDMIIPSTLIESTIDKVNENKVVFPGREIYYAQNWIDVADLTQKFWDHKTWSKDRSSEQFHGGIFICNKKAFIKVGGFDQRFEGYGSEDTSFYMRSVESNNADTTRVIDMIHINHNYSEIEIQAIEANKSLLTIYSLINPVDRIIDCKKHNIFHTS